MANSITSLNDIFKREYGARHKKYWTPEDWAKHNDVTDEDLKKYENARIGTSPLMSMLQEGNLEKIDMTRGLLDSIFESPDILLTSVKAYNGILRKYPKGK